MSSLSAPEPPIELPGRLEANSSLHHPQHNLGRGSCRVGKSSLGSLQEANLQGQRLAESFPTTIGIAPALATRKESLSEPTPLRQLCASEERTGQKLQEQVPLPTQLRHMMLQLKDAIATLHQVMHSLEAELADACAQHSDNNNNNNNNNNTDDDNNTNNNNNHTTSNNNNNDNDNNKSSRESGLNSLDLDNDNPESEPDLDETSLVSFNPAMGVESSSGSLDQQEADLSLRKLRPPNDDSWV